MNKMNDTMAGNLAAFHNYLDATLHIPVVTREAFINQGITAFDDLIYITDKDVKDMCSNAKKPGGTIPNPNYVAGGNMPAFIPNPGAQVGFLHEKGLRMLRFYRGYMATIQRPSMPNQVTTARLNEAWVFYEMLEATKDVLVDKPPKLTKQDDARKVIENLDNYLKLKRNV